MPDSLPTATDTAKSSHHTWRRTVWRLLAVVAFVYLLILALLMFFEESLIFFPSKYPDGDWQPRGLSVEDAWFSASDGTKLHGWYVAHPAPRAYVLFTHGNAGNISHRADLLEELNRRGIAVLAFDYRGYGRSEGAPTEAGVLDDARSARRWLASHAGIQETEIVLMGESLGGAVATILAGELPPTGLVLENTFSSVPDVAAFHYPGIPVGMLIRTRLDAASAIKNYRGPVLQAHGDCDTIVPFSIGQKLFAAANQPKTFVAIAGCDHNDPRSEQFYEALDRFIETLPAPSATR